MAKGKKTGGRAKGQPNRIYSEVGERCRQLLESDEYQRYFQERLRTGKLPPAVEAMTWHYAYGKPVERHEVTGTGGGPVITKVVHEHHVAG